MKRSIAINTSGKVATESFPAREKRKSASDKIYHLIDEEPPCRYYK